MADPPEPPEALQAEIDELRRRLAAAEEELARLRTVHGAGQPTDTEGLARELAALREASQLRRHELVNLLTLLGEDVGRLA